MHSQLLEEGAKDAARLESKGLFHFLLFLTDTEGKKRSSMCALIARQLNTNWIQLHFTCSHAILMQDYRKRGKKKRESLSLSRRGRRRKENWTSSFLSSKSKPPPPSWRQITMKRRWFRTTTWSPRVCPPWQSSIEFPERVAWACINPWVTKIFRQIFHGTVPWWDSKDYKGWRRKG